MAPLLLYLLLVSVLFAIAAAGSEQVCMQRGWPRRFIWLVTLVASLAFPLAIALTTQAPVTVQAAPPLPAPQGPTRDPSSLTQAQPGTGIRVAAAAAPLSVGHSWPAPADRFGWSVNKILAIAWLTSSVCCLLMLLVTWLRLSIRFRRCPQVQLRGAAVTVTHSTGPAVFGFLDPRILVPNWFLDESPAIQSVAITHEQQHIVAHDPQALLAGLSLVVLAPWNPALWWQLRRLRFAIEADCDARVLRTGLDAATYADVLLNVSQHRTPASVGLMALGTRASGLERRVRAVTVGSGPAGRLRAAIGLLVTLGVVAIAACVHAPGLASHELRKRPGRDTRPAAAFATAIARSHFPELFTKHFDGTAVVAVMLDQNGALRTVDKHLFAPGTVPTDFDLAVENARVGVDPQNDVRYSGCEYPPWTIGPWLDSKNPGRLFIAYEVLKWQLDPARTQSRVQAALAAYDPSLRAQVASVKPGTAIQLTVFMNDDGTVNRELKLEYPPTATFTVEDVVKRFAVLGVEKEQLGRRGSAYGLGVPNSNPQVGLSIDYAWPRRAYEPSDIADLNRVSNYPEEQITQDDSAIYARYFPDIERGGPAVIRVTVAGKQQVLVPWILFGRDGRVWDSGRWPTNTDRYMVNTALAQEIEIRYPGAKVAYDGMGSCRFHRVPIACLWITADSPVQALQDVDLRKRAQLLLTGALLDPTWIKPLPAFGFASGLNLNVQKAVALGTTAAPFFKANATAIDSRGVELQINLPAKDPADWSQTQIVHIPYGQAKIVSVTECCSNVPAHKVDLILRVQRLRSTGVPAPSG